MLEYAIKAYDGNNTELRSIVDGQSTLPAPPTPGKIDCIIAGFPWYVDAFELYLVTYCHENSQPHSGLNMFKKANDRKVCTSHFEIGSISEPPYYRAI